MSEKHMIRCNACGKEQAVSTEDGEVHRFSLCEACYDRIRRQFKLPVEIFEYEP